MRDKSTSSADFRKYLEHISALMAFEITGDFPTEKTKVRTPISAADGCKVAEDRVGIVAILRAGLGMVDGILKFVPGAKVGYIGLYRDPDKLRPVQYYQKLPS